VSAEDLRRIRDAEHQARRIRRNWEAALGGRSSLVAPLGPRQAGGVPPAGTPSEGSVGGGSGFTTTLLRTAAQTISVGGSALQFTEVAAGPRQSGIDVAVPTTTVTVPRTRIVSVLVRFDWVDWRAGGTVRLLRDGTVVDVSPASWGPRFSGVFHAGLVEAGEDLSVVVDHLDGSTQDLENVVVAVKVEGPALGTIPEGEVAGFYNLSIDGTDITLSRITDAGGVVLDTAGFSVVEDDWYWVRGQVIGQLVQGKAWAVGDPEPGWIVSATDTDAPLVPGYGGVSAGLAATSSRDYDLIEVSNDGAAAASNDMTSYTPGAGIPTGWERIYRASLAWSVVVDGTSASGQVLRHTSDDIGSTIVWTPGGAGTDQDVLIRGGVAIGMAFKGTSIL